MRRYWFQVADICQPEYLGELLRWTADELGNYWILVLLEEGLGRRPDPERVLSKKLNRGNQIRTPMQGFLQRSLISVQFDHIALE